MEQAAGPSLSNDLSVAWSLVSRLLVWTIHTALHLVRGPQCCTRASTLTQPWHEQLTQTLAFATITLPTSVFNLVHYSVSLSFHLTFLKLLAFFLFVTTVASYVWKVRYLNRYTELRDLPGGNRIKGDEGFDLCASSLLSRVIEYAH